VWVIRNTPLVSAFPSTPRRRGRSSGPGARWRVPALDRLAQALERLGAGIAAGLAPQCLVPQCLVPQCLVPQRLAGRAWVCLHLMPARRAAPTIDRVGDGLGLRGRVGDQARRIGRQPGLDQPWVRGIGAIGPSPCSPRLRRIVRPLLFSNRRSTDHSGVESRNSSTAGQSPFAISSAGKPES